MFGADKPGPRDVIGMDGLGTKKVAARSKLPLTFPEDFWNMEQSGETYHCLLVALFALLLEVIDTGEAYRLGRYRKSYSKRRPWYPPRRHTDRGSSKVYHSKRTPSEDYYSHRPADYSYHTGSDEYDGQVETKPYTIIIHLPKGERYGHNDYLERNKKYERDPISVFSSENDYIDETEDVERDYRDTKVVNVNNKKVQIKNSFYLLKYKFLQRIGKKHLQRRRNDNSDEGNCSERIFVLPSSHALETFLFPPYDLRPATSIYSQEPSCISLSFSTFLNLIPAIEYSKLGESFSSGRMMKEQQILCFETGLQTHLLFRFSSVSSAIPFPLPLRCFTKNKEREGRTVERGCEWERKKGDAVMVLKQQDFKNSWD
ncbi:hypothetical protein WN55_04218 [Dufourea novaeangliae]|uniref:Uncharacterized protein n=1 Tax=Dufourea novaeangliae TaxID=178035 RepID=A0A154NW28_DUFNO|nr:hypothetical protein WN55_04218 [Dufourea novaeangliae]